VSQGVERVLHGSTGSVSHSCQAMVSVVGVHLSRSVLSRLRDSIPLIVVGVRKGEQHRARLRVRNIRYLVARVVGVGRPNTVRPISGASSPGKVVVEGDAVA